MRKRIQVNVALEESEAEIFNEYCTVHDRTPQWLLKAGARRIIDEDILERKADLMTMQSIREIEVGLSHPIDRLLTLISQDKSNGEMMAGSLLRKSA